MIIALEIVGVVAGAGVATIVLLAATLLVVDLREKIIRVRKGY